VLRRAADGAVGEHLVEIPQALLVDLAHLIAPTPEIFRVQGMGRLTAKRCSEGNDT
jgi:hypothetical protein